MMVWLLLIASVANVNGEVTDKKMGGRVYLKCKLEKCGA
jgi:hypothetical protein